MNGLLGSIAGLIIATISAYGYIGVMLLMAVESACIPLPSEVIMPFAGYLVWKGELDLWLVAAAGALGCNLGSTLAYAVGYWGGRRAIAKWGRYVLLNPRDLDRAERYFHRWGGLTVLIGRMLPVVRTFISLPAGMAHMPQLRFQLFTFIGSWPWCLGLSWAGTKLGEKWDTDPRLPELFHRFDTVVVLILILASGWWIGSRSRESRRTN